MTFESTDARNKVGKGSLRIVNNASAIEFIDPIVLSPAPTPESDPMQPTSVSNTASRALRSGQWLIHLRLPELRRVVRRV